MVYVCKDEDGFIDEKPVWFVDLTNGERIWMDDGRPGIHPYQAWVRLNQYLQETGTDIARFYLKYRSHIEEPLVENAKGYFFKNRAIAFLTDRVTIHSMLVGHFDGERIHVQEWRVPELIQVNTEIRTLEQIKDDPRCLILKHGITVP